MPGIEAPCGRLESELAAIVGPQGVRSDSDREAYCVDGLRPGRVLLPRTVDQVAAVLRVASEEGLSVVPCGRGAFLGLGFPPRRYDIALSLRLLDGTLRYDPDDMTVTVEAGVLLSRLQETLGRSGQWLPVDPPLEDRVTVGGLIAADLSGPLRFSHGTARDFLLGVAAVRADGSTVRGGGKVVKNVAGYDLPKLYCGSLGTLGVLVEATFKVRPRPKETRLASASFSSAKEGMELALALCGSELQPLFLELWQRDIFDGQATLYIGFGGMSEEVAYQLDRLSALTGGGAVRVWEQEEGGLELRRLRDFPAGAGAALACKLSLPPASVAAFLAEVGEEVEGRDVSVGYLARAGSGIVYLRFCPAGASAAIVSFVEWLRVLAKRLGGYAVVEGVEPALKERIDVWGYAEGALVLMKKLKEKLDPKGILSPGRFVGRI